MNKQINQGSTFAINTINPFRMMNKKNFDAKGTMEFVSALKKGNVEDSWRLKELLENEDFDPKKGAKILKVSEKRCYGTYRH